MKNISKTISIFFSIFSIFLLAYLVYRSEFYYSGTKFDYYSYYYVISFVFIILSGLSFFLKKEIKMNLTIGLFSTIFGLYLIECYLDITNKNLIANNFGPTQGLASKDPNRDIEIKKSNIEYDTRTKFQFYKDLKKKDPNVTVAFITTIFLNQGWDKESKQEIFPFNAGISKKKTVHCNENGYFSVYQSDRYGFNNPNEEWDKNIEFFLVGDSFTHGYCVNELDTISGNLRRILNSKNGVLNLGRGGSASLVEYATLREYLPITNTKRVLWLYFENDLEGLKNELNNKILMNYYLDKNFTQNLIKKQDELDIILQNLFIKLENQKKDQGKHFDYLKFFKLYTLREMTIHRIMSKKSYSNENFEIDEFEKIMSLSKELVKNNKAELYFIYLPMYYRYSQNLNRKDFMNYDKVIEIIKNLNIPIIDIKKEVFDKHEDPLSLFPFRAEGHYNELGYKLIAEEINSQILN